MSVKKVVLYLHTHFYPSQFMNIANLLNTSGYNQYYICCEISDEHKQPNIISIGKVDEHTNGTRALIAMNLLKKNGIFPNVIFTHVGDGLGNYAKNAFPEASIIGFTEWFFPVSNDSALIKNARITEEINACNICITPTRNQKNKFPIELRKKILVMHEGLMNIHIPMKDFTRFESQDVLQPPIITYITRGFEPMRGFLEFAHGINSFLKERTAVVNVVGMDHFFYDDEQLDKDGKKISYKQYALEILGDNVKHVNFIDPLPPKGIRELMEKSDLHIYFTRDFVLSWSLIESLMAGCLVLASNTTPVQEIIENGKNGVLVNYTDPNEVKNTMMKMLDMTEIDKIEMREAAVESVKKYIGTECASKWKVIVDSLI